MTAPCRNDAFKHAAVWGCFRKRHRKAVATCRCDPHLERVWAARGAPIGIHNAHVDAVARLDLIVLPDRRKRYLAFDVSLQHELLSDHRLQGPVLKIFLRKDCTARDKKIGISDHGHGRWLLSQFVLRIAK